MSWFRMHRVRQELEARLTAPDGKRWGKLERKWYADGGGSLKLRPRETGLPAGTNLMLHIGGVPVDGVEITSAGARIELEETPERSLPGAVEGDLVEVLSDGEVVASGRLTRD